MKPRSDKQIAGDNKRSKIMSLQGMITKLRFIKSEYKLFSSESIAANRAVIKLEALLSLIKQKEA